MAAAAQRIVGLERQLADLAARFAQLESDAFYLKTLEEMIAERVGYPVGQRAALGASRPCHLHAVDGSGS